MASEDVALTGITVKGQEIGVANASTPLSDGHNYDLIGLAYPALTSAHPANDTSNISYVYNRLPYQPLLCNMHDKGLIDPYFSLALARTPQNNSTLTFVGYLSLGGLPPVPHSDQFAIVPVEIDASVPLNYTNNERVLSYWALTVSGIVYGPGNPTDMNNILNPEAIFLTNSTPFQAILDSGNYINYIPSSLATAVNALFNPPAMTDPSTGVYSVSCIATPPNLGFIIGNQTFFHDGRDLIYQTGATTESGEPQCFSSIATTDLGNILGVPFFKNVLTVYDFGANQIKVSALEGEVTESTGGENRSLTATIGSSVGSPATDASKRPWSYLVFVGINSLGMHESGLEGKNRSPVQPRDVVV